MTTLEINQIRAAYRGSEVQDVSFAVSDGQIAALFGRPGSGVLQALRAIAGLEPLRGGDIRIDELQVSQQPVQRRKIGLVQRDAVLFPGTVRDNVMFGLRHQGWRKDDRDRRVAEVLELVGMTGAEAEHVDTLSEGECARIALARAVAPHPAALLIDSPTWFVPEVDRIAFRGRLREVLLSLEVPVVIGTSDLQDAVGIADDLHVLHEGRLLQSGSVSRVLAGPSSIEVAELVGYVTLVRGEVDDGWILEPGAGAIRFPEEFPLSGTARALAHPSAMLGVPESSGLGCGIAGTIERVRATGPTYLLDLRVGERIIEVRWEWDLNPPDPEEPIAIAVTPGTLRFFNDPATPRPSRVEPPEPVSAPSEATSSPAAESETAEEMSQDDVAVEEPRPEAESPAEEPWAAVSAPEASETTDQATDEGSPAATWQPAGDLDGEHPPAPAPAPPRATAAEAAEPASETPSETMAPWLGASQPEGDAGAAADDDAATEAARAAERHRGMPLD